jgi:phage shock protein A
MLTRRVTRLWRAVVGSGLTELEANNALAVLDYERETLRTQVAKYNQGLAGHAGLCHRMKAEIAGLQREREELEPRIQARLSAGDRAAAARHALRLEAIEDRLGHYEKELDEAEATYRELVRAREQAIVAARTRIDQLKRSIDECKLAEALAELTELASGLEGSLGLSDGTLDRVKERLDERRHFAAGRVRVARESIDTEELRAREAEQAALAAQALERFEARRRADP